MGQRISPGVLRQVQGGELRRLPARGGAEQPDLVAGADPHGGRASENGEPEPITRGRQRTLRLEAMHQRDRFGRDLLARELESAAATIEELAAEMEARTNGEPGL